MTRGMKGMEPPREDRCRCTFGPGDACSPDQARAGMAFECGIQRSDRSSVPLRTARATSAS